MVSDRKLANAVGGRSARACDNCVKKRARWYCAADDAFLCQSCDSSVHSANPLARRHERVRLKTASSSTSEDESPKPKLEITVPSWEQGFTRKARTPRQKKHVKLTNPLHLVPEMCSEEQSVEENEVQLLYRVPIFDPFEFAVNGVQNDADAEFNSHRSGDYSKAASYLSPMMPSELDLDEFAADVESLLGKGLEDESFDMEELGLLDYGKESRGCNSLMVKVEEDEETGEVDVGNLQSHRIDHEDFDLGRETFELNLDFGSCEDIEEEVEEKKAQIQGRDDGSNKTFLKLDYEGVMSAWDDQKSPWTTGERPDFNSGDCWPECSGTNGAMHVYGMEMGGGSGQAWAGRGDGGREARVMRYREKRRTRLFSKKIRYEVRKLNAEKRPRMKGRFVKRTSFAASAFPLLNKSS